MPLRPSSVGPSRSRPSDRPRGEGPSRRPAPNVVGARVAALGVLAAVSIAALPSAAGALAPLPAPDGKPPHVLTLNADGFLTRLGPVRVGTRASSLARAYAVFGRPTTDRGTGTLRRVRWSTAGISVVGLTLGGCRNPDRCRTNELRIQTARVTGPRWQTATGLRVGDPAARIDELYPQASAPADGTGNVVVADAYSAIGDGGDIPILTARVRDDVVTGFDVWIGDAGD